MPGASALTGVRSHVCKYSGEPDPRSARFPIPGSRMLPFRTIDISDPRFEAEGLRHVTVKSPSLRGRGDLTVWAPAGVTPVALVVLLHGVYGSHWCWALKGGAHRTASRLIGAGLIPPLALAMPSDGLRGDGTAYMRHGDGTDYERWILDEVPVAARARRSPLSTRLRRSASPACRWVDSAPCGSARSTPHGCGPSRAIRR